MAEKTNICVTLATLESRRHEVNAIKTGTKLYDSGKVTIHYNDEIGYIADVEDKNNPRRCTFHFTSDGLDIAGMFCPCGIARGSTLCKHVVAGILTVQGGIPQTTLALGKTSSINIVVDESNTATAMQSGSLPVFATPALVALMERAACDCLADCLNDNQTSVGSLINVEHIAASPVNAEITATATIEFVFGRRIEFIVTAVDKHGIIGKGKHTRIIVDSEQFMKRCLI